MIDNGWSCTRVPGCKLIVAHSGACDASPVRGTIDGVVVEDGDRIRFDMTREDHCRFLFGEYAASVMVQYADQPKENGVYVMEIKRAGE